MNNSLAEDSTKVFSVLAPCDAASLPSSFIEVFGEAPEITSGVLGEIPVGILLPIPTDRLGSFCGPNDRNLRSMSALFGCRVRCWGNQLYLSNPCANLQKLFRLFVRKLLAYMAQGIEVQADLLHALYCASQEECKREYPEEYKNIAVGNAKANGQTDSKVERQVKLAAECYDPQDMALNLNGKKILPLNRCQHELLEKLHCNDIVFALGPAGTGKTFLAVAYGLQQLLGGHTGLLLLSRPVIEAGESLGFLPGDFGQKIGPYMLPLFDALRYLIKAEQVASLEAKGMIEVAPLAYMRGRSLRDAIVILDEAQNATSQQIKMLLTRLGGNAQAILAGDPSQSDLCQSVPYSEGKAMAKGLDSAARLLAQVDGVALQYFSNRDVVRSSLVQRIIQAYDSDTCQQLDSEGKSRRVQQGRGQAPKGTEGA